MDQLDLPHLDAGALGELACSLLRLPCRPGWPEAPFLLALPWGDPWRVDDLGFDLEAMGLRGGDSPLEVMCHQRAKPEWVAVGVVVDGWTVPPSATDDVDWRTLHRKGPPLRSHPQRRRVRTLHLVGRNGPVALALLREGAHEPEGHATADGGADGGPTGPLPDGLRRLLGLPTPPCQVPAIEMWASLWLAAVAARAQRQRRRVPTGWDAVVALYPGAQMLGGAVEVESVEHLVALGRVLARAKGWDSLHLAAVTGEGPDFLPPPDVAAWADAGMFARLVLRELEPLWSVRGELDGRLSPQVLARVDATLSAWQLESTPPGGAAAGPPPDHAA